MRCGSIIAGAAMGLLALCLCGCPVAIDLVNPDLLAGWGVDVSAIKPTAGTVIVMFNNHSQGQAKFHAFEVPDTLHPSQGSRNFSVEVQPGESDNEVLTCPVEVIGLGSLGANFTVADTLAVEVLVTGDTGGAGTVNYAGAPLTSPHDFRCGDLILVELGQDGVTLTVQVLPS